ncbi:MAG: hypothetical protein J6P45_06930 [Lachnospiraceae bacterium]|nr:hypothetical protein [Lachnospiraceae bacterium]
MEFKYTPELLEYMKRKGKKNISVEVASSDHSDFEVTELFYRFVKDDFAVYLRDKKRYTMKETEVGFVMLPPYRLHYDPVVTFDLKKTWIFHSIIQNGIRL